MRCLSAILVLAALLLVPSWVFSQDTLQKKPVSSVTLTPTATDTVKSKSPTGTSNLAVTDEGAPAGKPVKSSNKKVFQNPIEKIKKNLTDVALPNGTSGSGTTSNLAVTDEGVGSSKPAKGKTTTAKEAAVQKDTSAAKTPSPAATPTVVPK